MITSVTAPPPCSPPWNLLRGWLKKHPRFVLHFVSTRSSWLNLVERLFGELSRRCIRRAALFSVADLQWPSENSWRPGTKIPSLCLDRHCGINHGEASALPTNPGGDSTWLFLDL
jgi:hypothetical protein